MPNRVTCDIVFLFSLLELALKLSNPLFFFYLGTNILSSLHVLRERMQLNQTSRSPHLAYFNHVNTELSINF